MRISDWSSDVCSSDLPWCLTPYLTTEISLLHQAKARKDCLMSKSKTGNGPLAAGGFAAILASTCCLGPLILIALGFSGAWIGNLTALEPYRPIFIGVALVALFFAWRRIFRPAYTCKPDEVCAIPRVHTIYKLIFWIVAALVFIQFGFSLN